MAGRKAAEKAMGHEAKLEPGKGLQHPDSGNMPMTPDEKHIAAAHHEPRPGLDGFPG